MAVSKETKAKLKPEIKSKTPIKSKNPSTKNAPKTEPITRVKIIRINKELEKILASFLYISLRGGFIYFHLRKKFLLLKIYKLDEYFFLLHLF